VSLTVECPRCRKAFVIAEPPREEPARSLDGISLRGRFGLTKREVDIADLVIRGALNKDIAVRFGFASTAVVKVTLTGIYRKVGVRNRVQMTIAAVFGRRALKLEEARLCIK
jgi:DNA-binding NarL/FixJ family response regulator